MQSFMAKSLDTGRYKELSPVIQSFYCIKILLLKYIMCIRKHTLTHWKYKEVKRKQDRYFLAPLQCCSPCGIFTRIRDRFSNPSLHVFLVLSDNPKIWLVFNNLPSIYAKHPATFLCNSTRGFKRNTVIFIIVNSPTAAEQIPHGHSCLQMLMH